MQIRHLMQKGGLCAVCIRRQSVILDTGWCAPNYAGLWRSCYTSAAGVVYRSLQSAGTHRYAWDWPMACLLSRSEAELRYSPEFSHASLSCFLPSRLRVPSALRLSGATASFAFTLQSHKAPLPHHFPLFILFPPFSPFFLFHFLSISSFSLISFYLCLSSHAVSRARGKRLFCLKALSCQTRCVCVRAAELILHVKATQHTICHCCLFQSLSSEDPGACIHHIWNAHAVCR